MAVGGLRPPKLWVAITAMLRAQSVIELTPGPVLMLACQDAAVAYHGITHNNVAEKAALAQLGLHYFFSLACQQTMVVTQSQSGSLRLVSNESKPHMYESSLAEMVAEAFPELNEEEPAQETADGGKESETLSQAQSSRETQGNA